MAEYKDRIRVHIEGKEFSVVGGEFRDMLAAVKQINGRRFVGELKVWQLPGAAEDIQHQLEISGYYLEGGTPVADSAPTSQTPPSQFRDRIRIMIQGRQLAVVGGSFQDMLVAVKSLPGRRFDGEAKIWEIPGELAVIKGMIQAAGFELEGTENIPLDPISPMESSQFSSPGTSDSLPPPEPLDFLGDDAPPDFEAPDWEEDDLTPPPPNPPDWWDDELAPPPDFDLDDEPAPFDNEPSPFGAEPPSPTPPVAPTGKRSGGRSGSRSSGRIRIRVGAVPLVVTGGSFQEMLAAIKNIPGRRFNGQEKVWEIPDDVDLASVRQVINAAGFAVEPEY